MREISLSQLKILKKILSYNSNDFSLSPYFCSFAYNLGFFQMKFWLNKKNIFKFIKAFFKEIYFIINSSDFEVKGNPPNLSEFKYVVITWGNDNNIKNNSFIDQYFKSSNQDKSILWIIIFSGKNVLYDENVISIVPKTSNIYNKIKNFLSLVLNIFLKKGNLHNFTKSYYSANKIEKLFNKIKKKYFFTENCKFFFPYESQPFQNQLIKNIKSNFKNIKIFGYIHSFPAFPSHLVKKTVNPDYLIVNSKDQVHTFTNFLNWENKKIILLPSLRFKKKNSKDLNKQIFLPIKFYSTNEICKKLQELGGIYNLKDFKVRNHPAAKNSKKHLKLINEINKITDNCINTNSISNTSIFIGSTGAIVESLFHGIEPIHLMEDVEFEMYSQELWPSIESNFIKEKIVKYKLIDKNIVKLENNFSFENYLKL